MKLFPHVSLVKEDQTACRLPDNAVVTDIEYVGGVGFYVTWYEVVEE